MNEAYDSSIRASTEKDLREMEAYPAATKAVEDKYEKALAEYNKKLVEKKLVENNKTIKQLPPTPYLQSVPKLHLQTTYNLDVLATTYLHLNGYDPGTPDAATIMITLYGYDYIQPRTVSEQKDKVSMDSGGTSTYKTTYYHTEFSYRHPVSIRV